MTPPGARGGLKVSHPPPLCTGEVHHIRVVVQISKCYIASVSSGQQSSIVLSSGAACIHICGNASVVGRSSHQALVKRPVDLLRDADDWVATVRLLRALGRTPTAVAGHEERGRLWSSPAAAAIPRDDVRKRGHRGHWGLCACQKLAAAAFGGLGVVINVGMRLHACVLVRRPAPVIVRPICETLIKAPIGSTANADALGTLWNNNRCGYVLSAASSARTFVFAQQPFTGTVPLGAGPEVPPHWPYRST